MTHGLTEAVADGNWTWSLTFELCSQTLKWQWQQKASCHIWGCPSEIHTWPLFSLNHPAPSNTTTISNCPKCGAGVSYLVQLVLAERGRGVVEVQDGGGRLDDVPAALCAAEAVVSGQTEVLVAAAAIRKLKHLTRNHCLLLGHTAGWMLGQPGI